MLPENRPELEYKFVVVKRGGDLGRSARLRVLRKDGDEITLKQWQWPSGRPDGSVLADMVAALAQEVEADLVTRYGVQGLL